MSKHPIPEWLRGQFSRIEDEVHKLGAAGTFTQMRTVTQTYFEQLAAALQPLALGGEPESQQYVLRAMAHNYRNGHSWDHLDGEAVNRAADEIVRLRCEVSKWRGTAGRLTHERDQLKAEVERLQIEQPKHSRRLIAELKARNAELGGLLREARKKPYVFSGEFVLRLDAALAKTAGGEQV